MKRALIIVALLSVCLYAIYAYADEIEAGATAYVSLVGYYSNHTIARITHSGIGEITTGAGHGYTVALTVTGYAYKKGRYPGWVSTGTASSSAPEITSADFQKDYLLSKYSGAKTKAVAIAVISGNDDTDWSSTVWFVY